MFNVSIWLQIRREIALSLALTQNCRPLELVRCMAWLQGMVQASGFAKTEGGGRRINGSRDFQILILEGEGLAKLEKRLAVRHANHFKAERGCGVGDFNVGVRWLLGRVGSLHDRLGHLPAGVVRISDLHTHCIFVLIDHLKRQGLDVRAIDGSALAVQLQNAFEASFRLNDLVQGVTSRNLRGIKAPRNSCR